MNSTDTTISAPIDGFGAYYILNSDSETLVNSSQIEEGATPTEIEPPQLTAIDFVIRKTCAEVIGHTRNIIEGIIPKALSVNQNNTISVSSIAGTSLIFKCKEGEKYTFSTSGETNRYIWGFFPNLPKVGDSSSYYNSSIERTEGSLFNE